MISIALATYNGELYVSELLSSISDQTTLPDELIISDDSSTDSTLEIVNEFARNATFSVKILINKKRLGSTGNFEVAIRACSGDIIFPCDQDDIWYQHKIERMLECLVNNPSAGAVFSDADVVDQDLNLLESSLWQRKKITPQELVDISTGESVFEMVVKRNIVTGSTMAFRTKYRENILPIPCANNSLLVGVTRFKGSILSVASTHNNVSKLATKAIVKAVIQTCGFEIASKLGKRNWAKNEAVSSGTGTLTNKLGDTPH